MDSERSRLLELMEELAKCKANDAVKLAFPEGERPDWIDRLDLTALTGFKRTDKGSVEIQMVERMAALRLLVELSDGQEDKQAEFFQAWERKAEEGAQEET